MNNESAEFICIAFCWSNPFYFLGGPAVGSGPIVCGTHSLAIHYIGAGTHSLKNTALPDVFKINVSYSVLENLHERLLSVKVLC